MTEITKQGIHPGDETFDIDGLAGLGGPGRIDRVTGLGGGRCIGGRLGIGSGRVRRVQQRLGLAKDILDQVLWGLGRGIRRIGFGV